MIDLPPPDPGIEVVVASRGMSKGLAQTEGVQFVARAELGLEPFALGAQYKNISSATADGEAAVYVAVKRALLGFDAGLTLSYKRLTGTSGQIDPDSLEISPSIARKFGPVTARLSLVYSPDDLGATRQSAYFESGLAYKLTGKTSLSANLGRRERHRSSDYTAFNLGLTQTIHPKISADLRYYDTARDSLGDPFGARIVASLRARF